MRSWTCGESPANHRSKREAERRAWWERKGAQRRKRPVASPADRTRDSGWQAFALGGAVSGIGTGLINGQMTNAAMTIVAPERSGMASGINGTMRQVGVALGFAGLGAILAFATEHALSLRLAALHLSANDLTSLASSVVKGDIAEGAARLAPAARTAFADAARSALFIGFRTIVTVAGLVGLGGALLTLLLVRGPLTASAPRAEPQPAH